MRNNLKMRILVYSFNDKLGDGLQKISFIQSLKKYYPKAIIDYTTSHTTTLRTVLFPLVDGSIDNFIEDNQIQSSIKSFFIRDTRLVTMHYDIIIDLQKVVSRTLQLKKISHKKFFSTAANFLFSDYKNYKKLQMKNIYIEKFYHNIISLLGNSNSELIPEITIPQNNVNTYFNLDFSKLNIGIAPGAGDTSRTWGFENYLEVAKILRKKGYNVYFFIGPLEKELLPKLIANQFICPEWENMKMKSGTILDTMNLASKMSCLLCNDGGTSWIFEFAGIKTYKIFGITNEKKFARPGYSKTIQIKDFGFTEIKKFPVNLYLENLNIFLNKLFT